MNEFLPAETPEDGFKPLTADEVRSCCRSDAWIWRLYLAFRKVDRSLHRLTGKAYPYILPDKIKR